MFAQQFIENWLVLSAPQVFKNMSALATKLLGLPFVLRSNKRQCIDTKVELCFMSSRRFQHTCLSLIFVQLSPQKSKVSMITYLSLSWMPFHQIIRLELLLLIRNHSWHFEEEPRPRRFQAKTMMKVGVTRGQARRVERMRRHWGMVVMMGPRRRRAAAVWHGRCWNRCDSWTRGDSWGHWRWRYWGHCRLSGEDLGLCLCCLSLQIIMLWWFAVELGE